MDCVEYMRTLPDNHFDIAICDPPYGDAESGNFHLGGGLGNGSTATSSHKLPPPNQQQADWNPHTRRNVGGKIQKTVNHAYGGRFCRYSGGTN